MTNSSRSGWLGVVPEMSNRGTAAYALADLVERRRRVPHDEAFRLLGGEVVLVARSRGLVEIRGGGRYAELVPGRGGPTMFDPDWAARSAPAGRWR
jgi:hypothetical protein